MSNEYKEWLEDKEQEMKQMRANLQETLNFLHSISTDSIEWTATFKSLNMIMDYFNDQLTIV
jgi:mevalonate pyrophosphate decarboxylase